MPKNKPKRKNPMGVWWRRMMQKVKPSAKVYSRKQVADAQKEANKYLADFVDNRKWKPNDWR